MKQNLHYPKPDKIMIVEKAIKRLKEYPSKKQLKSVLPKKMTYQTFNLILKHLEQSGKIVIKNRRIIWIWNPKLLKLIKKTKMIEA